VIQGVADTETEDKLIQKRTTEGVDFALTSLTVTPAQEKAVLDKIQEAGHRPQELERLTDEELHILNRIVTRNVGLTKDEKNLDNIANDVIDGLSVNLQRGDLGLICKDKMVRTDGEDNHDKLDALSFNRMIKQEA
jgi:flavine halogenase